jgi:replicative DNA helicase
VSTEEERAVIGSILLRPDLLDEIAAIVRPADFEDLVNEQVFATIESMVAQAKPIDALTVASTTSWPGCRSQRTHHTWPHSSRTRPPGDVAGPP